MSINRIEQTRRKLLSQGKKIINLSSGNPNEWGIFFKNKTVNSFIKKYFASSPAYEPLPFGNYGTRLSLQNFTSPPSPLAVLKGVPKKTNQIKAENIALTSGTSESYFHLFRILNGEILLPRPGYPLFNEIARLSQTNLKWYDLDPQSRWQINEANLTKNITDKTKAIVLVSPNNPTGTVLNKKSLQTVIKIAEQKNLSIISDEVFCEYFFEKGKFPHIMSLKTNVPIYTLNGISKTYALPGYKLGWIMMKNVTEETKEELERSLDALLSSNQIAQALLPVLLKNGSTFIAKNTQRIKQNRQTMKDIFSQIKDLNYQPCQGGFYTFIHIKNLPTDDETFTIKLMEKTGIFVHPGYFYDYDNQDHNNKENIYIVISLLPPPAQFKKYLTQIKNFIQEVRMS